MAKIYYSIAGEGRGHATRARAVIEGLRQNHEIIIYTSDLALELLRPMYEGTEVQVREIPGLGFKYSASKKLDYVGTGLGSLSYIANLPALIRRHQADIEAEKPDLIITDFEPSMPRAARRCGVPFLSLDHQHVLAASDLSSLPFRLRCYGVLMGLFVRLYYRNQIHTVVSSFYFPPIKSSFKNVTQIGVLLRDEIQNAPTTVGDHVVAYLRRFTTREVLEALAGCGREVRIYGLGERPDEGNLRFKKIDVHGFIDDLATSQALISTAGNQLVGEALYLGKPVLAMPEDGNHEQEINAHFLRESGAGIAVATRAMTPEIVRDFLDRREEFVARIDRSRLCGNQAACEAVERHLDGDYQHGVLALPKTRRKAPPVNV